MRKDYDELGCRSTTMADLVHLGPQVKYATSMYLSILVLSLATSLDQKVDAYSCTSRCSC